MATYTIKGGTPHYERPLSWVFWELDFTATLSTSETVLIDTLPAGIVVLDARLAVTRAEAGSTSPTGGILVGDEPVVATSTALGTETVASATAAELVDAIQDGASAEQGLFFSTARTGTSSTHPKIIVALLLGRASY